MVRLCAAFGDTCIEVSEDIKNPLENLDALAILSCVVCQE